MTVGGSRASSRYDELWEANRRAVLGYLVRRCTDREDAADLLAETFAVAWRRLEDVPLTPDDRPWLFGVARNVLANHSRSLGRRARATETLRAQLRETTVPEPDADVLALRAALEKLDPVDRDVLTLAAWEGLTAKEIGQTLGLSPTAVSSRQARARARVRHLLQAPADGTRGPLIRSPTHKRHR